MRSLKLRKIMRGYDWAEVIMAYFGKREVACVETTVTSSVTNDKQSEAIMAQLVAVAWKVA